MDTPKEQLAAYFDTAQPRGAFDDEDIALIARLLKRCSDVIENAAAKCPRTYIVFRMIGGRALLPRLLSEQFDDGWFPVKEGGLPGFLDPRVATKVLQTQHLILTSSLHLTNGRHCHYDSEERRPFKVISYIGFGTFGQVCRVESRITYKQYALKTVRRRMVFGPGSKTIMDTFNKEMAIMKRMRHKHIVRYVGSYTDPHDLGLLMDPVADGDLGAYLEEACKSKERHPTLRTFFGCLATALSYLHSQGIKHRDIKPQNVLVHKANVLLTDFGISRDSLDTTTGPTIATLRYCSPEVAAYEKRNHLADVWSLGCVFLEMQAALQGRDLAWVKAYYEAHGTGLTNYNRNPAATNNLLEDWKTSVKGPLGQPLVWMEKMLVVERQDRPTAREITACITDSGAMAFAYSCGECCNPYRGTELPRVLVEDVVYTESDDWQGQVTSAPQMELLNSLSPLLHQKNQAVVHPSSFRNEIIGLSQQRAANDGVSDGDGEQSLEQMTSLHKGKEPDLQRLASAVEGGPRGRDALTVRNTEHHSGRPESAEGNAEPSSRKKAQKIRSTESAEGRSDGSRRKEGRRGAHTREVSSPDTYLKLPPPIDQKATNSTEPTAVEAAKMEGKRGSFDLVSPAHNTVHDATATRGTSAPDSGLPRPQMAEEGSGEVSKIDPKISGGQSTGGGSQGYIRGGFWKLLGY